jgi:hypothetical protein
MTKEKFLYELIDNWLYMVSWQCVTMENFNQKDRTKDYLECSKVLKICMDFYDVVYDGIDAKIYTQHEVDEKLEYVVEKLRQETVKKFTEEINKTLGIYIPNVKEDMDNILFDNINGSIQDMSKESLIRFMKEIRKKEVCNKMKGMANL